MNECKKTIHLMGTNISLWLKAEQAEPLVEQASSMLVHYESVFSANNEDSPLSMLKKTAFRSPQKVDPQLYELIKLGKTHSLCEYSYLNIAIGPLIKLWRIGFDASRVPDRKEIADVLELLKPELIQLDDHDQTVFFAKEGMELDLGAIAKGYFADRVMDFFKEHGAVSAMVNMGGNVLVFGDTPAQETEWNVGIQNPFLPRGNSVASIRIRNQSVVTSGIYERVLEKDGQKYHHIFDSRTGYPIRSNIASLTIVADKSVDCDIYSTRFFGADTSIIIQTLNRIEGLDAVVITEDGRLAHTKDLTGKITLLTE